MQNQKTGDKKDLSRKESTGIVGIFATWDYRRYLETPETTLKRKIEANPNYPFQWQPFNQKQSQDSLITDQIEDNFSDSRPGVFELKTKSGRSLIFLILSIVSFIGTFTLWLAPGTDANTAQYAIIPAMVGCGAFVAFLTQYKARRITLDRDKQQYAYYKGNHLIYQGHLHNIYIRLKGQASGSGDTYYTLVVDGYMVDEEEISGSSIYSNKLAKFGKRQATRLNLNYFDATDRSRYHVIRHRCPYEGT